MDVCGNCKNFGNDCEVTNPDALVNNCNEWERKEVVTITHPYSAEEGKTVLCRSCIHENEGCIPNTFDDCVKYISVYNKEPPDPDEDDRVNHPSHYTQGGIECIKAIEASMTPEGFQDYCKGNVLKYIWRWREKNGVEDLKKAQVYLTWMIESAEKEHHDIIGSGEDTQKSS